MVLPIISTSSTGSIRLVLDNFSMEIIQEKDLSMGEKQQQFLQRILHLISTMEKCLDMRSRQISEINSLIRNEICLKYSDGVALQFPKQETGICFIAILQFTPRDWHKYTEELSQIRSLCSKYSTEHAKVVLEIH